MTQAHIFTHPQMCSSLEAVAVDIIMDSLENMVAVTLAVVTLAVVTVVVVTAVVTNH
jgi:hypothetical protein